MKRNHPRPKSDRYKAIVTGLLIAVLLWLWWGPLGAWVVEMMVR